MKTTKVYVYRQQNFHADPNDKFIMGSVGIGIETTLSEDGKLHRDELDHTERFAERELKKEITRLQTEAGVIAGPPVSQEVPDDLL